jgi:hypothetical protein
MEREEAATLWPYDDKGNHRDVELSASFLTLRNPPPPDPDGDVIIEMDGVFANLGADPDIRQEFETFQKRLKEAADRGEPFKAESPSSFREVRQMRIYRSKDLVIKKTRKGKERRFLSRSETVTVVDNPVLFEKRVNAVCRAWRIDEYRNRVVLGDGGAFIWNVARNVIAPTHEILDRPHAKSHIHDCANALFVGSSDQSKLWAKKWNLHLKESGPAVFEEELQRLAKMEWSEEGKRKLTNLIEYVREHRSRIRYPDFKKLGFPVASGAIESANRQVVGDRCKRSGMRWTRVGLQRLLSLRAALLSGNWEIICKAIRSRRSTGTHPSIEESASPLIPTGPHPSSPPESASIPVPIPTPHPFSLPHSPPPPTSSLPQGNPRPASRPLIPDRKLARLGRSGFVMPEHS